MRTLFALSSRGESWGIGISKYLAGLDNGVIDAYLGFDGTVKSSPTADTSSSSKVPTSILLL